MNFLRKLSDWLFGEDTPETQPAPPPPPPPPVQPKPTPPPVKPPSFGRKVFISYGSQEPDISLAQQFDKILTDAGHETFLAEKTIRQGGRWLSQIESYLQQCEYFILLLSPRSAKNEMVMAQVRRAKEIREKRSEDKPVILLVRVNFPRNLPLQYNMRSYLERIEQQLEWHDSADTAVVLQEVQNILAERRIIKIHEEATESTIQHLPPSSYPQLEAEGELIERVEFPGGQIEIGSPYYIERPPIESVCCNTILQPGALIRIKAPRQMGKTSLMLRILQDAKKSGYKVVPLSFQMADGKVFADLNKFLQWFCASVGRELQLPNRLAEMWDEQFLGGNSNCTAYFEDYLLKLIDSSLVLGLDEVDRVFEHKEIADDFFGLLRGWHEFAKHRDIWKKLRLVVTHSTEVYIPLNINQSPFNVGLPVNLPEFNSEQVYNLAKLYGLDWTPYQVAQLMAMVGGHPYLVRLALYYIKSQDKTLEQLLKDAPTEAGIYNDHLRRHLWNLQQQPDLVAAFKQVAAANSSVRLEQKQAFKLHSMGLVHLEGNDVKLSCDLYRQYFGITAKNEVQQLGE